jgi:hypothetical protein
VGGILANKTWRILALIVCTATAIGAIASHAAMHWLKIRSGYAGYQHYGPQDEEARTILYGSSLAYDGIDWGEVSQVRREGIESWATAGSSPSEWEAQHQLPPKMNRAFIVVSTFDLNEYWLCDFRADVVPLGNAIRDLKYCAPDAQLCKRIISQYPQMFVRQLFPTAGRSDGVLVGIRANLSKFANGAASADVDEAPKFGYTGPSEVAQKLSDWPPARLQRRLALMRTAFHGKHWFDGPKKMALMRLLESTGNQGEAVIVVMPVSRIYGREFLSPQVKKQFEDALADAQHHNPHALIVRLDQLPALDDDSMFSDLVHLNMYGQKIATAALLKQLEKSSPLR